MNAAKWIVREIGPQRWWATHRDSGAAVKLPEAEALRLWRARGETRLLGLAAAREQAEAGNPAFVDLEFLGVRMRYWCARAEAAQEIASQYAGLLPRWRRSPDIEAELGHEIDFERLHRSVPGPRHGVRVREIGAREWQPGSSDLPILPLLQAVAFAGRYCGLHGALIACAAGGIIVCGEQKAGKTSTAMVAERTCLGTILADETTLIDRDATAHAIPLPIRERTAEGRRVRALPRADPQQRARGMNVGHIVILKRSEAAPEWQSIDDDAEALRLLVPQMRVLDTSLGEATDRLLGLVQGGRTWRWRIRDWPRLADDVAFGLREILGEGHGGQDDAPLRA